MKAEIKTVLVLGGVLVLGWLAQATQAGKGIEEFLGGIGKGIGELLSPRIVPEVGLTLCFPWAGLPCTVTTRETGALPGGGSPAAGFAPRPTPLYHEPLRGAPPPAEVGYTWEWVDGWGRMAAV